MVFVKPIQKASTFLWKVIDVMIIDGAVLLSAKFSRISGQAVRMASTGKLEHYLMVLTLGTVIFVGLILIKLM
jgi:NADH:ubiquinone oxidoreductase subunit 5 (subunit L)/multisubunit Na+/H+ antiporter MnhA subunit